MQQAQDFLDECEALNCLLSSLNDAAWEAQTLFKGWTINNILRHLHFWNIAADLSLNDEPAFADFMEAITPSVKRGRLSDFEAEYLDRLSGQALLAAWTEKYRAVSRSFASADPKRRVKWVGPDMSVISSIAARLMETWSHAQAIYDVMGVDRVDADRIGNIVRLGVNTFGWTFQNRRQELPGRIPQLRLTAPSGIVWEYGEPSDSGIICGNATEFCQVVTQCRNIADTSLALTGDVAHQWLAVAQCFAGPPQDPPGKGVRHKVVKPSAIFS